MSLEHTQPLTRYSLGILAAKDFDDAQVLEDLFGPKVPTIRHLFTNGANPLVVAFGRDNGIPTTIFPINGGRGLPASTRDVVDACDVVVIIATPGSKSAAQIVEACKERQAKEEAAHKKASGTDARTAPQSAFKWRVEPYNPIEHWRTKVCKTAEILAGMTTEERDANPYTKAVWRVIS